VRTITLR